MRILWIKSDFPLPADTGGKIRTLNLLKQLATTNQITFLCYAPPDLESHWFEQLESYGISVDVIRREEENKSGVRFSLSVFARAFSDKPYTVNKYITSEMAERVSALSGAGRFDIAICDFLEIAWCREQVRGIPTVLFEHNVETMIWRRYHQVETNPIKKLYFAYEKGRMERFERLACRESDLVLTVSDNDGRILQDEFGLKSCVTIPTGVDIDYFTPQGDESPNHVVFSGSMDWMPNIDGFWWFYQSILPRLRAEIADFHFTVVGRRPAADIVAVGERDDSVTITGTVADIRPFVAQGRVYVVPLRVGGGTRIKIYEAMAMKRCVLSTSIGAEGLPLTDGENIVIADTEEEFAKKLIELLQDDVKRNKIAEAGYELVTKKYSWKYAAEMLHDSLVSLIEERHKTEQR